MNNKQKYDKEYHEKHYKRISVVVKKEYDDLIKDRAADLKKSVNQYIVDLIMKDLEKNKKCKCVLVYLFMDFWLFAPFDVYLHYIYKFYI